MVKTAFIGAGSVAFARELITDILTQPALAEGTLSLMDASPANLELSAAFARKLAAQLKATGRIEATTERAKALDGADFVISTVMLNAPARVQVMQIAAKYGVDQAAGCSGGPGGIFRGIMEIPFSIAVARDMEKLCPNALFMDFANPTSITPAVMRRVSPIKYVGLCHSAEITAKRLAEIIGAPYRETAHWTAGINHMAWVLRFEWKGKDAYPLIWKAMEDPAIYEQETVHFELMKFTGYFPTESNAVVSDFVPFFRRTRALQDKYRLWDAWPHFGKPGAVENMRRDNARAREVWSQIVHSGKPIVIGPSDAAVAGIMNGMVTNTPYRFNGRVMNTGLITNLPQGLCVEVPCFVDATGIHPCYVGDLPPACAALNRARTNYDELGIKAVLEQDRWAAEQAIALDPLTGSILSLPEIHEMVEELFREMERYLWQEFK